MNSDAEKMQAMEHMADQIDHLDVVALVPSMSAMRVSRSSRWFSDSFGGGNCGRFRRAIRKGGTARVVRVLSGLFFDVRRDKSLYPRTITKV